MSAITLKDILAYGLSENMPEITKTRYDNFCAELRKKNN